LDAQLKCVDAQVTYYRALERFKTLRDQLYKWENARPFLAAGWSTYGRELLVGMMEEIEILISAARELQWYHHVARYEKIFIWLYYELYSAPPPFDPTGRRAFYLVG